MLFNISHFSEDDRYTSAVGRVRGLESQLLPASRLEHLLQSGSWHAILHGLRDTPYGTPLSEVQDIPGIQSATRRVFADRAQMIRHLTAPDRDLIHALLGIYDFYNLMILVKTSLRQTTRRVPLSPFGLIPPETLEKMLQQRRRLPEPLEPAWRNARQDFEHQPSLFRVEMILWRGYLDYLRSECEQSGIPFLQALLRYHVDATAILFALRWRYWLEASVSAFGECVQVDWALFPSGGRLAKDKIRALTEADPSRIPQIFQYTPYGAIFTRTSETLGKPETLWQLEVSLENLLTEMCRLTRYTAFGIEPLVAYLWFARQEYKNLRLILMGTFRNINPETIKPRLRMAYG